MRALLVTLIAWFGLFALDAAAQPACHYPYRVGYRVATIGTMRVALWYPTLAQPAAFTYPGTRLSGFVAPDAAPACGRVPLVVFSHGDGGCGTQSLFFTEELARRGYVVAGPDHDDAAFCTVDGGHGDPAAVIPPVPFIDPYKWSDETYVYRRDDLVEVIDTLIADAEFAPVINADAIGAAGHSLGGYTVVGLAGGWPTWKDPRVKAVLAMSPYVSPFNVHHTLGALGVPVMYQGAQFDIGITPTLEGANGAYAQTSPPKFFAKLYGGTHLVWSNFACINVTTVQDCLARPDPALIDAYGIAFLDHYLKGAASPLLFGKGPGLADYRFVP